MNYLKSQILKILREQDQPEAEKAETGEKTRGAGKGGFKASIRETGALAQQNPGQLMSNLGIKGIKGKSDIEKLFSLLEQAVGNTEAMSTVYGSPKPRRNSNTKKEGVRIPISVIPARDGMKYITHTILGAQNANAAKFDEIIQVEILGNDVLAYFAKKPKTWGAKDAAPRKKV